MGKGNCCTSQAIWVNLQNLCKGRSEGSKKLSSDFHMWKWCPTHKYYAQNNFKILKCGVLLSIFWHMFHNVPLTVYRNYKLYVFRAICSWGFAIPSYLTWEPILGKRSNSGKNSVLGYKWTNLPGKMVISDGLLNYWWSLFIAFWNLSCYALKKRAC